jgi:hypothetical protein
MNSNSDNSVYLIAKQNEVGTLTILNINANNGHKIGTEVNLVFDAHGNIVPFNGKKSGSHSHQWEERPNGDIGRKPVTKGQNFHLPIPDVFKPLVNRIVNLINRRIK